MCEGFKFSIKIGINKIGINKIDIINKIGIINKLGIIKVSKIVSTFTQLFYFNFNLINIWGC